VPGDDTRIGALISTLQIVHLVWKAIIRYQRPDDLLSRPRWEFVISPVPDVLSVAPMVV
jgi:hypothetical protein